MKKASVSSKSKSKSIKNVETIGVSGAVGSFSEEAGQTYARELGLKNYKLEYLVTIENTVAAIEAGAVSLAVFPVENSTMGIVPAAVDAMGRHNFKVESIFAIDVHQNLLVKKGVTKKQIKKIVSQDPAIKQCAMYLARNWPKTPLGDYADTAKAAKDLAAGKLPASTAVIASRAAARAYKLDILEPSIQDLQSNATTFIAARRLV
ncbi:MAG: prephenate dehydratase domain-containing protein [bacterium]